MKSYKVKNSSVHGKGLFATKRIRKGQLIDVVQGVITRENGIYVLWPNDKFGVLVTNNTRFINSSDQPNVAYTHDLEIVALKNIQPGAELLAEYDV